MGSFLNAYWLLVIGHRLHCIHLKLFNELQNISDLLPLQRKIISRQSITAFSSLPQLYEGREKERMCECVCVRERERKRERERDNQRRRDFGGNN